MMGDLDKIERIFVVPKYQDKALNVLKDKKGIQRSAVVTTGIEIVLKLLDKGMSMEEIEVTVFESEPSTALRKVKEEREKKIRKLAIA